MTNSDRIEQAKYLYQMIPAFDSKKVKSTLAFNELKSYVRQVAKIAYQGC